jgi:hypothetical protein
MHATQEQQLSCGVEWHLRANPRALFIYNLALRVSKTGKDVFVMSQPEIAASLGWDLRTAKVALAALLGSGLIVRTTNENAYCVLVHSELVQAGEHTCWPGAEGSDDGHSRSTPTSNPL